MSAGKNNLRSCLLAPFWVAQLATGAKAFSDNPVLGSPLLNEWGLHAARVRTAHAMAAQRRGRLQAFIDPADRACFDRDGFVEKRDFLPAPLFHRLIDGLRDKGFPAREMVQGDTVTRRIAIDAAACAAVPELRGVIADRRWRGLTRYAASFDSEPLTYIQTILAQAVPGDPDPQTRIHSDTFQPTVKAWLFLTDVAEEDGPLIYVAGSHRLTPARLAWERRRSLTARASPDRLSARGSFRVDAEELAALGLPPPTRFAVPANTLVVADTFGFHARGQASRRSMRCEIWAYGRRNPFIPWTGGDPLSFSGIAERRVGWLWTARDRLERFVGQPWRDVGLKAAMDPRAGSVPDGQALEGFEV